MMIKTEHRESCFAFPFIEMAPQDASENLPLIIQLHGAGECGNGGTDLDAVLVHGFYDYLKDNACAVRLIMPQCPKDTFWAARVESLVRFTEQLITAFDTDKARVYLTGLSMGGFGTWFTAMARPDLFAAVAPVCGGGMPWKAKALTMPVWAFHGTEDGSVDVHYSDDMVQAMRDNGLDVTYSRLDGVGHNAWDYTYDKALLDWLLSKKRK